MTGLQPSGQIHIGNYFGALKPFVDSYGAYDSVLMVVDMHAMTSLRDGQKLRRNTYDVVKDYIAAGVDPEQCLLFKQSDVPEHAELTWILDCLVTVPFLMTGHAYKDKVAKGLEANVGLFNYPMLMAADILLYDIDLVPVGEDNRQHIEFTREAAAKFNNTFGETFKMPQEIIRKETGIVPGTDGKKMSKSYGNTIPLFATRDEIAKQVMSIVTDSIAEIPQNVYAIHLLYKSAAELAPLYQANKGKYKALKEALIEDIDAVTAPMRLKRSRVSDEDVLKLLAEGKEKARAITAKTMADVRQKVGFAL